MRNLPFIALVAFIFSIPWQDVVFLPGNFAVSRILGIVLIFAGLGSMVRGGVLKIRRPSLMVGFTVLFVVWALFSSLWSINVGGGLFTSLIYIQLAIMVFLVWQLCRTEQQHRILLQAFVLGAYVLAGSTVYGYLTNPFVANSMQSYERYTGIGGNANGIAAIMALAIAIAWYLSVVQHNSLLRWINLIYVPTAVLGVILTASRGGAIIAVISLAVIPFTFGHTNLVRKITVSLTLIIMTIVVINLIPAANFERLAETSTEITEGNVSNRSQIWEAGLQAYSETPFLGIGIGSFREAVTPILGYSIPAHNAYILILTEMGPVGLALFLLAFLVTLLPLLRLPSPDRAFYIILWLALAVSILPSNDENAQHVWALLALMTTRSAYVLTFSHTAHKLGQAPQRLKQVLARRRVGSST